jgi:transaldolase
VNRVQALRAAGVSIWLDTLSRELLDSGEFSRLIADYGVTGATSNPTIFANAIASSDRYDDQLRASIGASVRDPQELFFELALDDVRQAADLLRHAYDASGGRDGFVSFECTPDLADDSETTIQQALEQPRRDCPRSRSSLPEGSTSTSPCCSRWRVTRR